MGNVVTPKLSSTGGFTVKTYSYGGSTTKMGDKPDYSDYEEIDYSVDPEPKTTAGKLVDGIYKVYSAVGAFTASVAVSATAGILEDVSDGLVMAGGFLASKAGRGIAWLQDKLGYKEAAQRSRNRSQAIEDWTGSYVAYDWSEAIYESWVKSAGYDEEIAHGLAHTAGNMVGTFAGYAAITVATGGSGAAIMAGVGATSAAGGAAQKALQNGATFDQAAINAGVAGVVGAASGAAMSGLGGVARGATNFGQVAGLTAAGAGVGAVTPTAMFASEYLTYGKDQYGLSAEGAKQYFDESGAIWSIGMGAAIGGVSTGYQGFQGVKNYNKLINSSEFDSYQQKVGEQFESDYKWDQSKKLGIDSSDYEMTSEEAALVQKRAEEASINNAKNLHKQYGKGYAQKGVSEEEFFDTIQNGKGQETVYSQKYIEKYNKSWNPDKNGNVEVVNLKPGSAYDNFVVEGGAIGRSDGEFVMPKAVADQAIKKCTVNGQLDPVKLATELALPTDTFKSGVVQVTQTVPASDVALPTSDLSGSYTGYWVPGGKTGGGASEGVVPRLSQGADGNWYNSSGNAVDVKFNDFR